MTDVTIHEVGAQPRTWQPGDSAQARVAPRLGHSAEVLALVDLALAEDIGRGDITTEATVSPATMAEADMLQKAPGVLCGLPVVEMVFKHLDPNIQVERIAEEGSYAEARRLVARIHGPASAILTGERTALNFIQRLSGVASASRRATQLVEGTGAIVLDTRKTTPGMRVLEKYAVRVGGARNHRAGLDDGFLIKENHIRAAGGITAAVHAAKTRASLGQLVETEVTNLEELDEAIAAGTDLVLLDNFTVEQMHTAVKRANGRVRIEASGGITLANIAEVARTGVNYISLGALTHSAGSLDLSLVFR